MAILPKEKLRKQLCEIFNQSNHTKNNSKCKKSFMKLYQQWYESDDFEDFFDEFITIIKKIMIFNSASPFTKRNIDFLVLLFQGIINYEIDKEKERLEMIAAREARGEASMVSNCQDVEMDELGKELFDPDETIINEKYAGKISTVSIIILDYLLDFIDASSVNIRLNVASLLKKSIDLFEEVDEDFITTILRKLNAASFDKDQHVRALLILSYSKLQNVLEGPENENAISVLKYHLSADPSPHCRASAIRTIKLSDKTIKQIFSSTKDINVTVRRLAYLKLANCSDITNFETDCRHYLLKNGLYDIKPSVNEVILKKLIPIWIQDSGNDLSLFLEYLPCKKDLQFYETLLSRYFQSLLNIVEKDDLTSFHKCVFNFKEKFLDEYRLLTKSELSGENSYLWYSLALFCRKKNLTYQKTLVNRDEDHNDEVTVVDLIDDVLPDVPFYCDFIKGFIYKIIKSQDFEDKNFIFIQLLKLGSLYKIRDEAQWNLIWKTFKNIILDDTLYLLFDEYIEEIFTIFDNYFTDDPEHFLELTLQLINSINNPNTHGDTQTTTPITSTGQMDVISSELSKIPDNTEQMTIDPSELVARSHTVQLQERMESDPKILERCLRICYSFLYVGKPKKNLHLLPGLIRRLVLSNLTFKDSEKIRLLAIKSLGCYCFASIDLINHFLKVFVEIIEEEFLMKSRVEALKFLFDFITYHGFKKINFIELDKTQSTEDLNSFGSNNGKYENFCSYFSDTIISFLEEPSQERNWIIYNPKALVEYDIFETCVKGVCKLFMMNRLHSVDLLSEIIVIYLSYKNITDELRQFIQIFLLRFIDNFPKYLKIFKDACTFSMTEIYSHSFKKLLDKDEIHPNSYEKFTHMMASLFTRVEDQKLSIQEAMKVFELTYDKELINVNLKFIKIQKMAIGDDLTEQECNDLKQQLELFKKRYIDHHEGNKQNKRKTALRDKNIKLFDEIIKTIKKRSSLKRNTSLQNATAANNSTEDQQSLNIKHQTNINSENEDDDEHDTEEEENQEDQNVEFDEFFVE